MSDAQIQAARKCLEWEWNAIDALTLIEWEEAPPRKSAVFDRQLALEVDA